MRYVNQDLNRPRQPNVLSFFGQLERLSGTYMEKCFVIAGSTLPLTQA